MAPLIPNPFSERSPFSGGLSGPSCVPGVPCRRGDALHFTPVSSRSAGVAGSFRWGLQLTYCGGVSSNHCFSSLYFFFLLTHLLFSFWASQMYSLCLSLLRCPFQPAPQAFHFGFLSCCVLNLQEPFGIDARSLPSLQGRVPSWHSPSPPACFFVSVFWFLPIMYTLSAEV